MKDTLNDKEKISRKKLYQVAKRFLMQFGIIQKHYKILGGEGDEKE
jgi:hypothetical protein